MGCCVSTKNTSKPPSPPLKTPSLPLPISPNHDSRAPPPSFQEEQVKEILLSEIPKTPPLSDNLKDSIFTLQNNFPQKTHKENLSETCSETLSTTTSCSNNNYSNDDYKRFGLETENEVKPKKVNSPNIRNVSSRVDSGRRHSPARRPDQSPARRNNVGSVKIVQSKEMSWGQNGKLGTRSDPNERSGRRSKSPGHNNVTRSPSMRKMNGSPGRVRLDPNGGSSSKRVLSSGFEDTWQNKSNNESLENPLVSLECFIFL